MRRWTICKTTFLIYCIISVTLFQVACKKIDLLTATNRANGNKLASMLATSEPSRLQVATLAGDGSTTPLNTPTGIAVDKHNNNVYVADAANNRIRKITPDGTITTLAGNGFVGNADGIGIMASFSAPCGVAVDDTGNVIVADRGNHRIRKITPGGTVTTLAGADIGNAVGPISVARFNEPSGVAIDGSGNIYIADTKNYCIRLLTPSPTNLVFTLAGVPGSPGSAEGQTDAAQFRKPVAITLNAAGKVYVADSNKIRQIDAGTVSTLAGSETAGFANGNGAAAQFNTITGLITDATGNLYVADQANHRIRQVTPGGTASTFAGNGTSTFADGSLADASFKLPSGVAIDANGTPYVADAGNNRIRQIRSFTIVIAGSFHSLIIKEDNSLWATGENRYGAFGDGTVVSKNAPVKIMDNVKAAAPGEWHSIILKTDNSVWATGSNYKGQLGDGTTIDKSTPVKIMDDVKAIAAGDAHSLMLKTDNSLWATGDNFYGELGDGTNVDKHTPVKIMDNVKAIAATGSSHSLILKTDNSLWATGYNLYGQLGDGTNTHKNTPVKIMDDVKAVSTGGYHSFILKTDNSLWATGYNIYGQLGDGTNINKNRPVKIMDNVRIISPGYEHSAILKMDNSLWTTGYNSHGELGDGTTSHKFSPVKVMDNVISASAGSYHTLIVKPVNTAWAVGNNPGGVLGIGNNQNSISWVRMLLP